MGHSSDMNSKPVTVIVLFLLVFTSLAAAYLWINHPKVAELERQLKQERERLRVRTEALGYTEDEVEVLREDKADLEEQLRRLRSDRFHDQR